MPTQWPGTSWLRSTLDRPFPRLVGHFAATIFEGESAAEDVEFGVGGLLALLAVPSGFLSILLFDKYSTLLLWMRGIKNFNIYNESVPDKYFFIVFSMAITGAVAVLKWDRILPGRRDYANLAPLPISAWRIFAANLLAILITAFVFAVDVNAASVVLYPIAVVGNRGSLGELARFAGVHAFCVLLASLFTFLACFSIMSALMALVPYRAFRRIALYVRLGIVVALVALVATSFAVPDLLRSLSTHPRIVLLPPVWFLALYQSIQGHASRELAGLSGVGVRAVGIALGSALLFCSLSYRRCFMRISESTGGPLFRRRAFLRLSTRLALFSSYFQRACYGFAMRALLRSEKHCIFFGGFAGMGLVAASETALSALAGPKLATPDADTLSIPLIVAYFLICGLRFVFEMPVELESNWMFQVVLDADKHESAAVARNVILTVVTTGIVVPAMFAFAAAWSWRIAILQTIYLLAISLLLIEGLLVGFRKIPFTCSFPPFRNNVLMLAVLGAIGYFVFTGSGSEIEHWMMLQPLRFFWLLPAAVVAYDVLRRFRNEIAPVDAGLIYREQPKAAVTTLDVFGN
jgi:hypothetical protein